MHKKLILIELSIKFNIVNYKKKLNQKHTYTIQYQEVFLQSLNLKYNINYKDQCDSHLYPI